LTIPEQPRGAAAVEACQWCGLVCAVASGVGHPLARVVGTAINLCAQHNRRFKGVRHIGSQADAFLGKTQAVAVLDFTPNSIDCFAYDSAVDQGPTGRYPLRRGHTE